MHLQSCNHVLYFHLIDIVHHLSNSQFWRFDIENPQTPDFSQQKPAGTTKTLSAVPPNLGKTKNTKNRGLQTGTVWC